MASIYWQLCSSLFWSWSPCSSCRLEVKRIKTHRRLAKSCQFGAQRKGSSSQIPVYCGEWVNLGGKTSWAIDIHSSQWFEGCTTGESCRVERWGGCQAMPAPYPWSTTHFTDSWLSSMWRHKLKLPRNMGRLCTHHLFKRSYMPTNLANQAAFRRTCVWKPNGGWGQKSWFSSAPLVKYTHRTGPAQRELSISAGNKCHSGATALYRYYAPNPTTKEGQISNLKIENNILLGVNLSSEVFTLHLLKTCIYFCSDVRKYVYQYYLQIRF